MLKRLRFRNWRSLRDVEIDDLTPITVFIGPNSSGKSNILDAMDFTRRLLRDDYPLPIYSQAEREQARTIGSKQSEPMIFEYEFLFSLPDRQGITHPIYTLEIKPQNGDVHFNEELADVGSSYKLKAHDGSWLVSDDSGRHEAKLTSLLDEPTLALPSVGRSEDFLRDGIPDSIIANFRWTYRFIIERWQLLGENFIAAPSLPAREVGPTYFIEKDARNTILILEFMQQHSRDIYQRLTDDLNWLMSHLKSIRTETDRSERRLMLFEAEHPNQEAPTISAGTSRLIAMLTAYYALDMLRGDLPGLVAIEEPDMAVHPLLLKRFVELLRTYVEGEHPRQFILTTHNPRLLDYFGPEEVRIVRRDEHGYTTIDRVPDHIERIWLDKYGLGEVWMTRSLGDVE